MAEKEYLVTGASSGIGAAMAEKIASRGGNLILTGRNLGALEDLGDRLQKHFGVEITTYVADLSNPAEVTELAEKINSKHHLHGLINNAGLGCMSQFAEQPMEMIEAQLQVNIVALTRLTRLLSPAMISRRSGHILNVASIAAFQPGPKMAVYYASKAFVYSFSEALREELKDSGVSVTCLCPGPTQTGFFSHGEMQFSKLAHLPWMQSANEVAEIGVDAMFAGKGTVVSGLINQALKLTSAFAPRFLQNAVVEKIHSLDKH